MYSGHIHSLPSYIFPLKLLFFPKDPSLTLSVCVIQSLIMVIWVNMVGQ